MNLPGYVLKLGLVNGSLDASNLARTNYLLVFPHVIAW